MMLPFCVRCRAGTGQKTDPFVAEGKAANVAVTKVNIHSISSKIDAVYIYAPAPVGSVQRPILGSCILLLAASQR